MFKKDFPIFQKKFIYLDTAASAQKPMAVIQSIADFYKNDYANVHKGICGLSQKATDMYEESRNTVAQFLKTSPDAIVFTKGATESLNLLASALESQIDSKSNILVSISEHHANFVPWQQLALRKKASFNVFNVLKNGAIDLEDYQKKLQKKPKIVAFTAMSNVLGVINPLKTMIDMAHEKGALVVLDVAQAIAHMPLNVKELNVDFLAFSGHKLYGPTGIGVLYIKPELQEILNPYQFGGDMVDKVYLDHTVFKKGIEKFEAGTPSFVNAYGLKTAIEYIQHIGWDKIKAGEEKVSLFLCQELAKIKDILFIGNDLNLKTGLVSFVLKNIPAADIAFILGKQNVCVRVGHHCAMPIHTFFNQTASVRVSLGLYNDIKDIENFIQALEKVIFLFEKSK